MLLIEPFGIETESNSFQAVSRASLLIEPFGIETADQG